MWQYVLTVNSMYLDPQLWLLVPVISVDFVNVVLGLANKVRGIPLQHLDLHPGGEIPTPDEHPA